MGHYGKKMSKKFFLFSFMVLFGGMIVLDEVGAQTCREVENPGAEGKHTISLTKRCDFTSQSACEDVQSSLSGVSAIPLIGSSDNVRTQCEREGTNFCLSGVIEMVTGNLESCNRILTANVQSAGVQGSCSKGGTEYCYDAFDDDGNEVVQCFQDKFSCNEDVRQDPTNVVLRGNEDSEGFSFSLSELTTSECVQQFGYERCYAENVLERFPGFENETNSFQDYIGNSYRFSIWFVGGAAFFMILIGGFWYLVSAGNQSRAGEAKNIIWNALYGVAMIIFAWLLLFIINPDLVQIDNNLKGFRDGFATFGDGNISVGALPGGNWIPPQQHCYKNAAGEDVCFNSSNATDPAAECEAAQGAATDAQSTCQLQAGQIPQNGEGVCPEGISLEGSAPSQCGLLSAPMSSILAGMVSQGVRPRVFSLTGSSVGSNLAAAQACCGKQSGQPGDCPHGAWTCHYGCNTSGRGNGQPVQPGYSHAADVLIGGLTEPEYCQIAIAAKNAGAGNIWGPKTTTCNQGRNIITFQKDHTGHLHISTAQCNH